MLNSETGTSLGPDFWKGLEDGFSPDLEATVKFPLLEDE